MNLGEIEAGSAERASVGAAERLQAVIEAEVAAWRGHKTYAWAGECGIFADYAWNAAHAAGLAVDLEGFCCEINCAETLPGPPGLTVAQLCELGVDQQLDHAWLVYEGRYYDASSPIGVASPFDLRCVRQAMVEVLREQHPGLLATLTAEHEWWRESERLTDEFLAIAQTRESEYQEN